MYLCLGVMDGHQHAYATLGRAPHPHVGLLCLKEPNIGILSAKDPTLTIQDIYDGLLNRWTPQVPNVGLGVAGLTSR